MKYKASIRLKRVDTEGRVPAHTLDDYVRGELLHQVSVALKPYLSINQSAPRNETENRLDQSFVAFTTELVVLQPDQWHQLSDVISQVLDVLPSDQQNALRLLINTVENRR